MDANTILMGGGVPSAKFETVGASARGTVDNITASQQTDFTTGELLTWPNGDPRMQVLVDLATEQRDPAVADDDGRRRLYIKGKNLTAAVREAVRKAGAKGLEVGGLLTVTYIGDGTQEKRGINAPKLYEASYRPPDHAAAANAALGLAEPAATPPAAPDLSALAPEARALIESMLAKQQGAA